MTYDQWYDKLMRLNAYINSIKPWNDHAEEMQREYDFLLTQDPRLKENKNEREA